jgi:hypothetical protein
MHMTELNLGELIMDQQCISKNLTSIYIIDKIYDYSNDFLKQLLKNRHFSRCDGFYNIIMCYYIVRYMSREEGLSYIIDINNYIAKKL